MDNNEINTDLLDEIESPIPAESPISSPFQSESPIPSPNLDLSHIQTNLNSFYKKFNHNLTYVFKSVPLVFYMDYKKIQMYEQSNKIIAPKELLKKLSEYEDLVLPVYIKINDSEQIFGIADYVDFIEHIYIPSKICQDLELTENEETIITILKETPVKATELKIKPLNEEFYEIQNIKTYLEVWLKKMYITLSSGEIINLPYRDGFISLFIDEVQPEPLVSIYDIDEVKIDLLPMDEYANKKGMSLNASKEADDTSIDKVIPNKENKPNEFRSFSGKGNKLGSS